jgi:hypothetical protein
MQEFQLLNIEAVGLCNIGYAEIFIILLMEALRLRNMQGLSTIL